ncbi:MAG TPA: PP2C family protein-serine/threonine phosphatase [Candidatus Binatia bacterium]|nr:PP2C family protein-serine/threonine phosphatase [Candidatus Binatia bacterium]
MAFVRAVMRSALDRTGDPVQALELMNHILVDERRTGLFVTILAGVLDLDTGVFAFANAGHERPLIARADGSEPWWVEGNGPLVGVFGRLNLTLQRTEIRPGERMILYTDGITDAQAPDGSRFGEGRLLQTIAASCRGDGTAAATVSAVIRSVLEFQGAASPADDLALLVFRRLPTG